MSTLPLRKFDFSVVMEYNQKMVEKEIKINTQELERLAELSRLSLSGDEQVKMLAELNGLLQQFRRIDAVNVTDVKPTYYVTDEALRLRADEAKPSIKREELLKSAPQSDGSTFIVPKIME